MATAVIGAGASGLVTAIVASRRGEKVTIFEQNKKIGRRILATGNGRCNISNKEIKTSNYHSQNSEFIEKVISKYSLEKCLDFFHSIGLETVENEKGRLYPMSLQASSVVDLLLYECQRIGITFILETKIESISKGDGKFLVNNQKFDKVVLATGGISASHLGNGESGYNISTQLGHTLTPLFPSLVQLVSDESYLKSVSGVKFDGKATLIINKEDIKTVRGDVLFTDYGVSGSAILDISRFASEGLKDNCFVEVSIDLLPSFSKEKLRSFLQKRAHSCKNLDILIWLEGVFNKKLASLILNLTSFGKEIEKTQDLTTKDLNKLIYIIKNIKLNIIDTRGFKTSEVTAGGVDTTDINPTTMESKLVKNLYLVGELLDIDGDCGGYNLHFAWGCGILAGHGLMDH